MNIFHKEKNYYFTGAIGHIENRDDTKPIVENKYQLGYFVRFIDIIWGSEYIKNGKAIFDNGVISFSNYDSVVE